MMQSINIPAGKFAGEDDVESADNCRIINGIKAPLCDLVEADSEAEKVSEIQYETEKEEKEKIKQSMDAVYLTRQRLRMLLTEGFKVRLSNNGYNQAEEMIYELLNRCNSYLELLPSADNPQKILHAPRCGFHHILNSDSSIPPCVIIDPFDYFFDRVSMKDLQIIYKSDRCSYSYEFNIQPLLIRPIYFALILAYFLKESKFFFSLQQELRNYINEN